MRPEPARGAFTLIELLVALATVAVLLGLTLAGVQRAREAARRADCLNRVRQQGLAVLNYESTRGHLPPGAVQGPFAPFDVPPGAGHGLWAFLLPQLDQAPAANRYRFDRAYDHPDNQSAAAARVAVLVCPNAPADRTEEFSNGGFGGVADYVPLEVNPFLADLGLVAAVADFTPALPSNKLGRLAEVTDGLSNTLLLAEASGRPGVAWSSPLCPADLRQVFGGSTGFHRGGVPACLADGSARFVRDAIDLRALGALGTRAGGEVLGDW
jgi:type II secretory pathway pseudopilin PulG